MANYGAIRGSILYFPIIYKNKDSLEAYKKIINLDKMIEDIKTNINENFQYTDVVVQYIQSNSDDFSVNYSQKDFIRDSNDLIFKLNDSTIEYNVSPLFRNVLKETLFSLTDVFKKWHYEFEKYYKTYLGSENISPHDEFKLHAINDLRFSSDEEEYENFNSSFYYGSFPFDDTTLCETFNLFKKKYRNVNNDFEIILDKYVYSDFFKNDFLKSYLSDISLFLKYIDIVYAYTFPIIIADNTDDYRDCYLTSSIINSVFHNTSTNSYKSFTCLNKSVLLGILRQDFMDRPNTDLTFDELQNNVLTSHSFHYDSLEKKFDLYSQELYRLYNIFNYLTLDFNDYLEFDLNEYDITFDFSNYAFLESEDTSANDDNISFADYSYIKSLDEYDENFLKLYSYLYEKGFYSDFKTVANFGNMFYEIIIEHMWLNINKNIAHKHYYMTFKSQLPIHCKYINLYMLGYLTIINDLDYNMSLYDTVSYIKSFRVDETSLSLNESFDKSLKERVIQNDNIIENLNMLMNIGLLTLDEHFNLILTSKSKEFLSKFESETISFDKVLLFDMLKDNVSMSYFMYIFFDFYQKGNIAYINYDYIVNQGFLTKKIA